MYIIKVLITGLAAGAAAFIPLSGTGLSVLVSKILGFGIDYRLMKMILLGIFAAGVAACYPDLLRLLGALIGIIRDLISNLRTFLKSRRGDTAYGYKRILTGNYRWMLLMIGVALVPALIIGALTHAVARFAYGNLLAVAMGFFVTALILFVSSYMAGAQKTPKKMKITDGLIIGLFDGFSFIPGISKIAATSGAGFILGVSRKATVRISYVMVLILTGFMILRGVYTPMFPNRVPAGPGACIVAFLGAAASGYYVIRRSRKLISRRYGRLFAIVNLAIGILTVIVYL
jgi:undecaprenyl pyrophosphate phosphatase UppP